MIIIMCRLDYDLEFLMVKRGRSERSEILSTHISYSNGSI